jgi:hypothetical protein
VTARGVIGNPTVGDVPDSWHRFMTFSRIRVPRSLRRRTINRGSRSYGSSSNSGGQSKLMQKTRLSSDTSRRLSLPGASRRARVANIREYGDR